MSRRLSLAREFLLASLIVLLVGMLVIGLWVSWQIESGVLNRTAAFTALYVESFVEPHLRRIAQPPRLSEDDMAALDLLLTETPLGGRIVAFKVWSPEGEIIYSPNRDLIGRTFAVRGGLAQAVRGVVAAELSDLSTPENEFERQKWNRLLEVYVPVFRSGEGSVLAITEFYQLPDELDGELAAARLRSWVVVVISTVVMYVLLAGIVKRGSDVITRQQEALQQQVAALSQLLEQNARLQERVRRAAGRTTALNEQALRRVSADLHDGPGQALSLALLRMEALAECCGDREVLREDFAVVERAVRDALGEIRSISAGLRLPELATLPVSEVAGRAIRDHERRSGTAVRADLGELSTQAPLAVKIALFRSLQEALSNATRHGGGVEVTARVWIADGFLRLAVSDRGPGFAPEGAETSGRLGLAGMRERAEMLGGEFRVTSNPGLGTMVDLRWPLKAADEAK